MRLPKHNFVKLQKNHAVVKTQYSFRLILIGDSQMFYFTVSKVKCIFCLRFGKINVCRLFERMIISIIFLPYVTIMGFCNVFHDSQTTQPVVMAVVLYRMIIYLLNRYLHWHESFQVCFFRRLCLC